MRVIGHNDTEECPVCGEAKFCDDCGVCGNCGFALPDHEAAHPAPPAPALRCDECGGGCCHTRACSVTKNAANRVKRSLRGYP